MIATVVRISMFALLLVSLMPGVVDAQTMGSVTLFENVRVFNGVDGQLSDPVNVLVRGNVIEKIARESIPTDRRGDARLIDGTGKVLMPGLIDAHTHIMFSNIPQQELLLSDIGYINVVATKAARDMLMRGYTSIRDLGGPSFGLKKGIDRGLVVGPRIWPSGSFISQTGGHGDFRLPNDLPARPGEFTFSERVGAAAIADSPDLVRQRVREQLALGASQIKLMAGGGVSSAYDPLDVTQYTLAELQAAVEAAENWGTYVTVHAYTPAAVQQAIKAGVKCIDHGQLLDDATAQLMADQGIWWSLQPFVEDGRSAFPEGSPNRLKQLEMFQGTAAAYALAKQYKIKTAWGTDILFSAENVAKQNDNLIKMLRWYTAAETLKMATSVNAELLSLSGLRSPYRGRLGVIEEGALADLLLVDGDPLDDLRILTEPETKLLIIMKDGIIHKDLMER